MCNVLVMNINFRLFLFFISLFLFSSCAKDTPDFTTPQVLDEELISILKQQSPSGSLEYFTFPESHDYNQIPQDPKNPITQAKTMLGGFLFHETGLSSEAKDPRMKGTFSCASCHHASAGFQAGVLQGLGEGGSGFGRQGEGRRPKMDVADHDVQPVRSPSAMNGAWQPVQLWNGQFGATGMNSGTQSQWKAGTPIETNFLGYEGLETQAIAGMGVHRMEINDQIKNNSTYKKLFDAAFPEIPEEKRYTKEYAGLAIAAYERTLMANKSGFQKYLKGDHFAMRDDEKRGAILFFGKAKCSSCHTGPALNSMNFYALGMGDFSDCIEPTLKTNVNDVANLGRASFTGNAEDNYKFKVPQLYNLKDSPFYGHGGSLRSVRQVIQYKNNAIAENSRVPASKIDKTFVPLGLSENEINDLEAFLLKSLYDYDLNRYVPSYLPTGLCFPNADTQSRIDLNCN